jgi:hypothetical protein
VPSFFSFSDISDTLSENTSIFSDQLLCTSTISTLDSAIAPSNSILELMKIPAIDDFLGNTWSGSVAHGDFERDCDTNDLDIDLDILSALNSDLWPVYRNLSQR